MLKPKSLPTLIILVVLGLLPLPAITPIASAEALKIVLRDLHGSLGARPIKIRALCGSGQQDELQGTCHSACTMSLGLQNLYVGPDAVFGFHGPGGVSGPQPRDASDNWSDEISRGLRGPFRHWLLDRARQVR